MDRVEATREARKALDKAFVVLSVASFEDPAQEEDVVVRIKSESPSGHGREGPEQADIWYVTLGIDSVEGDGDFTITARVTADSAKVVDFEARS